MKIHARIDDLRAALKGRTGVVFVPTMGNLHAGHLALVRQAKPLGDITVSTIFVNRLQFAPHEDFDTYPRTFQADCDKLTNAGVAVLFAPSEQDLYPEPQEYFVEPPAIQNVLDGEFRPGHFRGVATVVSKLFNCVQPQAALFGKKDYQQLMILRNMTRQMALPVEIVGGETVRASDGLALSSRNGYLTAAQRAAAPVLYRTLREMAAAIQAGERDYAKLIHAAQAQHSAAGLRPDYLEVREANGMRPATADDQHLVILLAAFIGSTRLIDNLAFELDIPT